MASADDDLEALFDAEASQYNESAQKQQSPSANVVAAAPGKPIDKMEQYYQAVCGLYLDKSTISAEKTDVQPAVSHAGDAADNPMFERLGGIVRLLHDSLRELGYDKSLSSASSQITDANDRLEYIATLTEQSANKVLNTLDAGIPAQEGLIKQGKEMEERWALLFAGKIGIEDFKILAADSRKFAAQVVTDGEKEKARLLEIMMAQDFQDLTGQIIKKVVAITKTVEQDLAQLLLDNSPAAVKDKHVDLMSGPSVPSAALVQNDVDDLLADLGF
ncbi:MAG TPA: protein phosphatase CheZ [Burkholderiaceae bacterium]